MTHTPLLLLPAAALALLGTLAPRAARPETIASRVLDERTLVFREDDEPERAVGEVRATLRCGADGGVRLGLVASAVGPGVDAAPGPEGVRGGNRITAEELGALLERTGLSLRVRGPRGASPAAGTAPTARRGALLVRRLDAAGRATHVPAGGGDLALEAMLDSPALADGVSRVEVVADGRVRVRATVRVARGGGALLALEQVADREARP